jgi:hypothetical protein
VSRTQRELIQACRPGRDTVLALALDLEMSLDALPRLGALYPPEHSAAQVLTALYRTPAS